MKTLNRSPVSLSRPLARLTVLALAVLTALVGSVALAGSAAAHVSVSSTDAAPGGFGKLTFRVPNESDTASTVAVRIQIPEESALASLRAQPVPGWTVELTESELAEPIESHGREITSYVSIVEFRAVDGAGIGPGQFQEFALSGGPFPDADQLTFPTVQSYSDGNEVAWIEPTVDGAEPEHPAPVLTLTVGAGDPHSATDEQATAAGTDEEHDTEPGAVALFLSILALLVGGSGAFLGWRAWRRTVSS
jgi:uncharacterized protein YcnI